jgi:hypothetical protein
VNEGHRPAYRWLPRRKGTHAASKAHPPSHSPRVASPLQRSDEPSTRQVRQAIATAIAAYGVPGCAARVAQDYGEHPETALTRMRWALTAAVSASGGSQAEPARAPAPGHCTVLCTARAA